MKYIAIIELLSNVVTLLDFNTFEILKTYKDTPPDLLSVYIY
jgi:hypothetical protein